MIDRKFLFVAAAALAGAAPFAASAADEFSQWEVRVGAVRVDTKGGSDAVPGLLPPDAIIVQSKTIPEIDISYFFTKHIAAELVLTYPQPMDVAINAGGIGHVGHVDVLPPDIMAQYHFLPDGRIDPYVGAGLNITWLTNEDFHTNVGRALALDVSRTSVEPALQIGTDYKLDRHWVANVDVKYEWMSFDVRSAGNKISSATVDPWLFRLAVGYKF